METNTMRERAHARFRRNARLVSKRHDDMLRHMTEPYPYKPYKRLDAEERALVDSEDRSSRERAAALGLGLDYLIGDECASVRKEVARSMHATFEMLETLACDEKIGVRAAVAENCYTPKHVLAKLAADESETVRNVARSAA